MIMPVMVLALQTTAQISRYMRASMLDNLNQDYVRTARAKGLTESCRVGACAAQFDDPRCDRDCLGIPSIFGGAIITENVFKVNGIGQLLITPCLPIDIPMVMTLTFIFAILIVFFNLIADVFTACLTRGSAMTDTAALDNRTFGALSTRTAQATARSGDVWDQFRKHKGACIGGGFLLFITLFCAVGPWLWDVDPKAGYPQQERAPDLWRVV